MADYHIHLIEGVQKAIDAAPRVTITRNKFGYEVDLGHRIAKYKRTTTLLKGIPMPALVGWGINQVANYAVDNLEALGKLPKKSALKLLKGSPYDHRDDRALRGTHVHNAIDDMSKGMEMPEDLTDDERCCVEGVQYLMANRNSKILASEVIGFNDELNYAGTFDHWEIDRATGTTWLLDWKTSKAIYPDNGIQMVAYQNFTHIILNTKKVKTESEGSEVFTGRLIPWLPEYAQRLGVVHVEPHGATIYPVQSEHHDYLYNTYRSACEIKNYMSAVDTWKKKPKIKIFESTISYGGKIND
tara:strand:+ start:4541 stop:5440 length:900 start_codon:yes stop_codon:yes gene_type:complete